MKVWVDMTASAHPLVFRPLVQLLEEQGHVVEITARDYAQTLQLIESHGMTATVIGHHGGRSSAGKARQLRARQICGEATAPAGHRPPLGGGRTARRPPGPRGGPGGRLLLAAAGSLCHG